jgi:hypothetical protein
MLLLHRQRTAAATIAPLPTLKKHGTKLPHS